MQAPRTRTASALALALLPPLLSAAVAFAGARSAASLLLLWLEPLLLAAALYGILYLAWERRSPEALALLFGAVTGATIIHQPTGPLPIDGVEAEWSERLRDCANASERPRSSIRAITWTVGDEPLTGADLRLLTQERPDLLMLSGSNLDEPVQRLARQLEGESKLLPSPDGTADLAVIVRGAFQYCGGREDVWEMPLPRHTGGPARAILSFPEIRGVGVIPLLAVQLDRAGPPTGWLRWARRLHAGSRQVAALARALGSRRMLVLADARAPRTVRQVSGHLQGAGLDPVGLPATWPDRLGVVPLLPVHALDRAWHGDSWVPMGAHTVRSGHHDRRAVVMRLGPR